MRSAPQAALALCVALLAASHCVGQAQGAAVYYELELNLTAGVFSEARFVLDLAAALSVPDTRFEFKRTLPGNRVYQTVRAQFWINEAPSPTAAAVANMITNAVTNSADGNYAAFHTAQLPSLSGRITTAPADPPASSSPGGDATSFDPLGFPWLFVFIGAGVLCLLIIGGIIGLAVWRKKKNDAGWY
jgi:hypothetical protein